METGDGSRREQQDYQNVPVDQSNLDEQFFQILGPDSLSQIQTDETCQAVTNYLGTHQATVFPVTNYLEIRDGVGLLPNLSRSWRPLAVRASSFPTKYFQRMLVLNKLGQI